MKRRNKCWTEGRDDLKTGEYWGKLETGEMIRENNKREHLNNV